MARTHDPQTNLRQHSSDGPTRYCKKTHTLDPQYRVCKGKKIGSFSLIERVILSAGAMLIFSVYFQLTICPEGQNV
ncbi:hypothetical protein N7534_005070 [Penicillium rubens]|nr:hypothetical protein N7534_005070 [Penicillium rubens]